MESKVLTTVNVEDTVLDQRSVFPVTITGILATEMIVLFVADIMKARMSYITTTASNIVTINNDNDNHSRIYIYRHGILMAVRW